MARVNSLLRVAPGVGLFALVALSAVSGCSLVIDSDSYLAPRDAGTSDQGRDGGADQGPLFCNGVICPGGWSCLEGQTCVECQTSSDCASGFCDTEFYYCFNPITDCSQCAGDENCYPNPSGAGDVCLACDRDGDGFLSAWSVCDAVHDGGPRDCDDFDSRRYPGAAPICNDGVAQACPMTDVGVSDAFWFAAELGRVPVQDIAAGVAYPPQLTVVALAGDTAPFFGGSQDESFGAYAFVSSANEAELHLTTYGWYDANSQTHSWRGGRVDLRTQPAWPYDPNSVGAFTVGDGYGQLYLGVQGNISGSPYIGSHALDPTQVYTYYQVDTSFGFQPPLAFHGRGHIDLFYRQGHLLVSEFSRLSTLANGNDTTASAFVSSDPNALLDTESGYMIMPAASGLSAEAWDGIAAEPLGLATTSIEPLVGPPRFSRDPFVGTFIALLPYASGVRVVRFDCEFSSDLPSCTPEVSAVQTVLPNLGKFDFEIFERTVVVVEQPFDVSDGVVVAHVLSLGGDLTLTRQSARPITMIGADDTPAFVTSVYALETDLGFGPSHVEVLVGAVVELNGLGSHVLGTSLRACRLF